MEQNPLYRLYIELNDKVNKILESSLAGSTYDLTDLIVRIKALETKPSYDNVISTLTAKINVLESVNTELTAKLEKLNKIDNLESRLYVLESEPKINIDSVNERLDKLEQNNYSDNLNDINNKLSTLESSVTSISDIIYRVNELEKKPDLAESLNEVTSKLAIFELSNNTNEVLARVNELEKKPDLTQRLTAIEQIVTNISNGNNQ